MYRSAVASYARVANSVVAKVSSHFLSLVSGLRISAVKWPDDQRCTPQYCVVAAAGVGHLPWGAAAEKLDANDDEPRRRAIVAIKLRHPVVRIGGSSGEDHGSGDDGRWSGRIWVTAVATAGDGVAGFGRQRGCGSGRPESKAKTGGEVVRGRRGRLAEWRSGRRGGCGGGMFSWALVVRAIAYRFCSGR